MTSSEDTLGFLLSFETATFVWSLTAYHLALTTEIFVLVHCVAPWEGPGGKHSALFNIPYTIYLRNGSSLSCRKVSIK